MNFDNYRNSQLSEYLQGFEVDGNEEEWRNEHTPCCECEEPIYHTDFIELSHVCTEYMCVECAKGINLYEFMKSLDVCSMKLHFWNESKHLVEPKN